MKKILSPIKSVAMITSTAFLMRPSTLNTVVVAFLQPTSILQANNLLRRPYTMSSITSQRLVSPHEKTTSCFSCRPFWCPTTTSTSSVSSSFCIPLLSVSSFTQNTKTVVFFSNKSGDEDVTTAVTTSSNTGSNCTTTEKLSFLLTPEEIAASLGPDRQIATKPFTWEELKLIVQNGDPTMHSRSMEVQGKYLLHSRQVKKLWRSMNDYILCSKFGFEKVLEDNTGKYISKPCLQDLQREKRVEKRLLRNEYPYYVGEGIEHWCLWKLGGKVEACDIDMAVEEMKSDYKEVLAWVNPPHLQSIPDIDHAHLLCLRSLNDKCA